MTAGDVDLPSVRARATVIAVAALVAVAAGAARGAVPNAESQSRVVDRTLLCRPLAEGAPDVVRIMRVAAWSGSRQIPSFLNAWDQSMDESVVRVGISMGPGNGLSWSRTPKCSISRLRVSLSSKGLQRGTTGAYGDDGEYVCDVPASVLVRIRALFRRPTALSVEPPTAPNSPSFIGAKGTIESGYLAITTVRGRKPIAFGSVTAAPAKARLFVESRRCYVD
jgi:hypothetical protein